MIRVTYLGHSGFLLEWPGCYWLFDWWRGELPAFRPEKPLLVFVSHRHEDHFTPAVFQISHPKIHYLLSQDIRLTERNRVRWNVPADASILSIPRRSSQSLVVADAPLALTALPSTDEGVAFLAEYQGKTVYHAGDLNWWHWEGEGKAWNHNMAADFKRALEPLSGRAIDLAFAPLDPRQEDAYSWGLQYLLETADLRHVIPMHCWEDYSVCARFRREHPSRSAPLLDLTGPGQTWELEL